MEISDSLLGRYINGETSREENLQVQQWAAESATNSKYMENMQWIKVHTALPQTPKENVQLAWENLARRIKGPAKSKSSFRVSYQYAAAAMVTALLIAALFIINRKTGPVISQAAASNGLQGDGLRSDTLVDGSVVRLEKNSMLYTASGFGQTNRSVRLNGGGYFSVVHNAKQPFQVQVNDISIRDAGTSFTVQSDSLHTMVKVVSGLVDIMRGNKSIRLAAGEQSDVGTSSRDLEKLTTDTVVPLQTVKPIHIKKPNEASLANDPKKLKQAMRLMLQDIRSEKLVAAGDSISWFGLTVDKFMINGLEKPASVREQFCKKYHVTKDNGFFYGPVQMTGNGFFVTQKELEEP